MNEYKLSERLLKVAQFVPKSTKVADIGSDHAYLPSYLTVRDTTLLAIAGEINEGPYQSAKKQIERLGLSNRIQVRKGSGLAVIEDSDQVDVITIAGMGGALITSILEEGKGKLGHVKRLILQPNVGAIFIRDWLLANHWSLIDEVIIEEDEKIYEVLVAEKGHDLIYDENRDAKLLLGPFLMKEASLTFIKKWTNEQKHWTQILHRLEQANESEDNQKKKAELKKKIQMVQEVI
ncbi:tRNA (adenine(22)-N(1))-methyltransferase [Alkalihalobacillus pseudalcaliphilus]|uniref:tRNA (adenine(22)-N(1))-methyltransferase n=1 Tax=Alkalihalobacillus pseudalcaliphilus TaxID=79884 RepID=UPI00064DD477|nr:tRNA (adenine(22)-N(1))-methyltransferase TrmK [Alkalihalobacillus pseudalcaliphilus]KMK75968.1 SAM-dependent methyltransferase [Alkalihalobacillus pseudalcaliphilus]